jgi:hypothetical protein
MGLTVRSHAWSGWVDFTQRRTLKLSALLYRKII